MPYPSVGLWKLIGNDSLLLIDSIDLFQPKILLSSFEDSSRPHINDSVHVYFNYNHKYYGFWSLYVLNSKTKLWEQFEHIKWEEDTINEFIYGIATLPRFDSIYAKFRVQNGSGKSIFSTDTIPNSFNKTNKLLIRKRNMEYKPRLFISEEYFQVLQRRGQVVLRKQYPDTEEVYLKKCKVQ